MNEKKRKINLIGLSGKIKSGKDATGKLIMAVDFLNAIERHGGKKEDIMRPDGWTLDGIVNCKDSDIVLKRDWQVKKFADKLKQWTAEALGITREQLEDENVKSAYLGDEWSFTRNERHIEKGEVKIKPVKYRLSPRIILQKLGTEVGREVHSNFWVNCLFAGYTPRVTKERIEWTDDQKKGIAVRPAEEGNDYFHVHHPGYSKWIITDCRFPNEAQAIKERGGILIRVERSDAARGVKTEKNPHISETALDGYRYFDHIIQNNGTLDDLQKKIEEVLDGYEL